MPVIYPQYEDSTQLYKSFNCCNAKQQSVTRTIDYHVKIYMYTRLKLSLSEMILMTTFRLSTDSYIPILLLYFGSHSYIFKTPPIFLYFSYILILIPIFLSKLLPMIDFLKSFQMMLHLAVNFTGYVEKIKS